MEIEIIQQPLKLQGLRRMFSITSTMFSEIIPEMFQLAADNKLKVETVQVKLQDIENCGTSKCRTEKDW
jgi:hypothetical protein